MGAAKQNHDGGVRRRAAVLALAALYSALASAASACSVPVFRYALERWPADPYTLIIFHRGRRPAETADLAGANVDVRYVDVDGRMSARVRSLWRDRADVSTPLAVLAYPGYADAGAVAWSGPADAETMAVVADSPARAEIARRILSGQSAVWVFLPCGDRAKDEAAEAVLTSELARLARTLQLPEPEAGEWADAELTWTEQLRIELSTLTICRDDSAERVFVRMLLGLEPGLAELDEPMAFPVFGRGRVLYALVGAGIEQRNIADACRYLLGACSCEAKRQNPGVDLLTRTPWADRLSGRIVDEAEAPPLIRQAEAPVRPTASAIRTDEGEPAAEPSSPMGRLWASLAAAVGVVVVGGAGAYGLLRRRMRS